MSMYDNPDFRAMHAAWACVRHARANVNPENYAWEIDWHRIECLLATRLTEHGAELPPTAPRGPNEMPPATWRGEGDDE